MILSLWYLNFLSVQIFSCFPNLPINIMILIVILMPTIGYIDQFFTILKSKRTDLFNKKTGYILLLSNYLWFIYWSYEPFQVYLLGQSISVFLIILLLSFSTFSKGFYPFKSINFKNFIKSFKISNSQNYFEFFISLVINSILILLIITILCIFFGRKFIFNIIIVLSNLIDTLVSFPQLIQVIKYKNFENCSMVLIYQYLIGDILKLFMFYYGKSGFAFIFGSIIQTLIDFTIFYQYLIFKNKRILY